MKPHIGDKIKSNYEPQGTCSPYGVITEVFDDMTCMIRFQCGCQTRKANESFKITKPITDPILDVLNDI